MFTSPTAWTWVWASSGSWWWIGRPGTAVHGVAKDTTEWLNWTELNTYFIILFYVSVFCVLFFPTDLWYAFPLRSLCLHRHYKRNQRRMNRGLVAFNCLCAKPLQSSLTLCNPMDCSPPCSSVHGILQASILKWVATSSSRGSSSRCYIYVIRSIYILLLLLSRVSHVRLCATP